MSLMFAGMACSVIDNTMDQEMDSHLENSLLKQSWILDLLKIDLKLFLYTRNLCASPMSAHLTSLGYSWQHWYLSVQSVNNKCVIVATGVW